MGSYRDAGVDLEGADRHVRRIGPLVKQTWGDNVHGGFGGFAAGVEIPAGIQNPILMMSTDGVGTKLELARQAGKWDGVGYDLVAMCVDDLTAVGARPIGFVDYMAVGKLYADRDAAIVASVARACLQAGCPLLGGETAEHPGVMDPESVDLAGAALGVVERGAEFNPKHVSGGDVVIGLSSPNLRSNGFSLVRSALPDPLSYEVLLEPSVIYGPAVLAVAAMVKSAAHITGVACRAISPRSPDDLGIDVNRDAWTPPDIFQQLAATGISDPDMFATFNMGIGFCLIVAPSHAGAVMADVAEHNPVVLGIVTDEPGVRIS